MDRLLPILISFTPIITVFACTPQSTTENLISNIDVDGAKDLIEKDAEVIVLDVRTPEEYANGHIEGAINIGIADPNFEQKVSKLDQSKTYLVHCAANVENGRSAKSLDIMSSLGFSNLLNMEGGIAAWVQSDYPVVQQ